jgi:hypothetical protein
MLRAAYKSVPGPESGSKSPNNPESGLNRTTEFKLRTPSAPCYGWSPRLLGRAGRRPVEPDAKRSTAAQPIAHLRAPTGISPQGGETEGTVHLLYMVMVS